VHQTFRHPAVFTQRSLPGWHTRRSGFIISPMFARLRRHPWIALLLIVASPPLAGGILPLLHPCPVDFPWLVAGAEQRHDAAAMAHGSSHQDEHHQACHCPGCSQTPRLVLPAVAAAVAALTHRTPATPAWLVIERVGDAVPILEYLPETTAPPLV
jgi:hypothetical protein